MPILDELMESVVKVEQVESGVQSSEEGETSSTSSVSSSGQSKDDEEKASQENERDCDAGTSGLPLIKKSDDIINVTKKDEGGKKLVKVLKRGFFENKIAKEIEKRPTKKTQGAAQPRKIKGLHAARKLEIEKFDEKLELLKADSQSALETHEELNKKFYSHCTEVNELQKQIDALIEKKTILESAGAKIEEDRKKYGLLWSSKVDSCKKLEIKQSLAQKAFEEELQQTKEDFAMRIEADARMRDDLIEKLSASLRIAEMREKAKQRNNEDAAGRTQESENMDEHPMEILQADAKEAGQSTEVQNMEEQPMEILQVVEKKAEHSAEMRNNLNESATGEARMQKKAAKRKSHTVKENKTGKKTKMVEAAVPRPSSEYDCETAAATLYEGPLRKLLCVNEDVSKKLLDLDQIYNGTALGNDIIMCMKVQQAQQKKRKKLKELINKIIGVKSEQLTEIEKPDAFGFSERQIKNSGLAKSATKNSEMRSDLRHLYTELRIVVHDFDRRYTAILAKTRKEDEKHKQNEVVRKLFSPN
ncbi:uncharacterized protein LOC132196217 [Neocloeon triangulifer]|uniref:uncharacterized protein LOC132196217 n=1 Tax=Neocloeon triangulifer TaxID=2078957 RepID=UPI00286F9FCA|nr:uncharacterized protein LOC132196217 [Neocloeon triangulifer]